MHESRSGRGGPTNGWYLSGQRDRGHVEQAAYSNWRGKYMDTNESREYALPSRPTRILFVSPETGVADLGAGRRATRYLRYNNQKAHRCRNPCGKPGRALRSVADSSGFSESRSRPTRGSRNKDRKTRSAQTPRPESTSHVFIHIVKGCRMSLDRADR